MLSNLAIARLAFAASPTPADALLAVARLNLEIEAAHTVATRRAADTGLPDATVSVDLTLANPPDRVDKTA